MDSSSGRAHQLGRERMPRNRIVHSVRGRSTVRSSDDSVDTSSAPILGGDAVAQVLRRGGVDTVFAMAGGHIDSILSACSAAGISAVMFRDERSAAFAAAAYGAVARRVGVCIVTAGPGFTNAMTGLAQAHAAKWPVLSIAGRFETVGEGRGALQEIDQECLARPIAKLALTARTADTLVPLTEYALRTAAVRPYGHVHLSVPVDLVRHAVPARDSAMTPAVQAETPALDSASARAIVESLARATRPMLIVGGGAWFAHAEEQVDRFVHDLRIPTFTHEEARGLISDDDPLGLGDPLYQQSGAAKAIPQADLVLLVGAIPDWRLDYLDPPLFAPSSKVIRIHGDSDSGGVKRDLAHDVVADEAKSLQRLRELWVGSGSDWSDWTMQLRNLRDERRKKLEDRGAAVGNGSSIHPARVMTLLDRFCAMHDANVVVDGGNVGKWAKAIIRSRRAGQITRLKGPFASIGHGVASGIVRALVDPAHMTVLITGDGSFGYGVLELETALRLHLNLIAVVGVDSSWGSVRSPSAVPTDAHPSTDLAETRFDLVAEALGAGATWVEQNDQLDSALVRAASTRGPFVIAVRIQTVPGPARYPAGVAY